MSVCLYRRISINAEPIGFSLTGQLFIAPGKIYNYFGREYHNRNHKKIKFFFTQRLERNLEIFFLKFDYLNKKKHSKCHQRTLGTQLLVQNSPIVRFGKMGSTLYLPIFDAGKRPNNISINKTGGFFKKIHLR